MMIYQFSIFNRTVFVLVEKYRFQWNNTGIL